MLVREILPQEVSDQLHDVCLIIARLIPDVVSRKVTSQVNPVKLEKKKHILIVLKNYASTLSLMEARCSIRLIRVCRGTSQL